MQDDNLQPLQPDLEQSADESQLVSSVVTTPGSVPQTANSSTTTLSTQTKPTIDDQLRRDLNLSEGEEVLCVISRHPIGKFVFYFSAIFGILAILTVLYFFVSNKHELGLQNLPDEVAIALSLLAIFFLTLVNFINIRMYNMNRIILTNECVMAESQQGLFHRSRKNLNLESIEDVGYEQKGIFSQILGYATLKIATVGKDSVHFTFAENVKENAEAIENAREQLLKKQRLEERGGVVVNS